jgi:hypothetical protein
MTTWNTSSPARIDCRMNGERKDTLGMQCGLLDFSSIGFVQSCWVVSRLSQGYPGVCLGLSGLLALIDHLQSKRRRNGG